MKQKAKASRALKPAKRKIPSVKSAKSRPLESAGSVPPGSIVGKVLAAIKAHPGIRPSEINRLLNLEQSDSPRAALIKRGLIRKEQDGSATRYYPV
jgi:hypothetical protein